VSCSLVLAQYDRIMGVRASHVEKTRHVLLGTACVGAAESGATAVLMSVNMKDAHWRAVRVLENLAKRAGPIVAPVVPSST
jgi:hypothetical protein